MRDESVVAMNDVIYIHSRRDKGGAKKGETVWDRCLTKAETPPDLGLLSRLA